MCEQTNEQWSFYSELLPSLAQWALQFELVKPMQLLEQGNELTNDITALEARFILASGFFLNLHNLRMTFCKSNV